MKNESAVFWIDHIAKQGGSAVFEIRQIGLLADDADFLQAFNLFLTELLRYGFCFGLEGGDRCG